MTDGGNQRGFTLIEMMVVVTIMGIIIGVAAYAVGGTGSRQVQSEANQLAFVLNHLADQALMKQQTLRWVYDEKTRRCETEILNAEQKWEPLAEKRPYHCDFKGINRLLLHYEEHLTTQGKDLPKSAKTLYFLSSGDYTPFSLTVNSAQQVGLQLMGDGLNSIQVEVEP
jgi:general secretion pathway protein H